MSMEMIKGVMKRQYGFAGFSILWPSSDMFPLTLFKRPVCSTGAVMPKGGVSIPQVTDAFTPDMLLGTTLAYDAATNTTKLTNYDDAGDADGIFEFGAALRNSLIVDSSAATGNTHAAFSNGAFAIPANLRAGQRIRFLIRIKVTGQNSTDTQRFRLLFTGADLTGTAVYDTGAVAYEANDLIVLSGEITVRVAGASGKVAASGLAHTLFSADPLTYAIVLDETSKDLTLATHRLVITALASSASAGNTAVLKDFNVEVI